MEKSTYEIREGYKMTELGEIPVEWEVLTLEEILDVRDGTHDSPKYVESGIPFATSKNLKNGKLDFNEINFITKEDHAFFSQRSHVENGDILFGMIGTIGNPVIVDTDFEFSIKNVALIKFAKSKINNKFILEVLNSTIIEDQFRKKSNGGVQKFISLGVIRKLKIVIPPLSQQIIIAEILSTVDEQIENTGRLIEKTKELKKGLMQQLLTKGIGHAEFKQTELGKIPVKWEIQNLKEVGVFSKGKGIAKKDLTELGQPCILYGELYTTYTETINTVVSRTMIDPQKSLIGKYNDVLIPSSGETAIDIATASFLSVDNVLIGGDINLFRPNKDILGSYISYSINSVRKTELAKLAQGSSVYHLYSSSLSEFSVLVPPVSEQQKIAEILTSVDNQIEIYEQEKVRYQELKKGLMQQLLTGKLRVTV